MKILSATPASHGRTTYIAEFDADELNAMLCLAGYAEHEVKTKDGANMKRNQDRLERGDVIDPATLFKLRDNIQMFLNERSKIQSFMSQLKGALTKLENTLPV